MKNKIILLFLLLLIPSFALQAQNKKWEEQLNTVMASSNAGSLSLLKYTYVGKVKTDAKVEKLKKKLLSKDNYIPFDGYYLKMKDIKHADIVQHYLNRTSEYFNMKFYRGMGQVKLLWKYANVEFESLCVVGDDGIIFDHILMNLFTFKEREIVIESSDF